MHSVNACSSRVNVNNLKKLQHVRAYFSPVHEGVTVLFAMPSLIQPLIARGCHGVICHGRAPGGERGLRHDCKYDIGR
jgi:hypothetical protein